MKRPVKYLLAKLFCQILMTTFLFLSFGSESHVEAAQPKYKISFLGNTGKPICVGQAKAITVFFELNEGQSETQPPIITFNYTNGILTHQTQSDSFSRGFVFVTFIAETPGTATLGVTAWPEGGTANISFTILKECNYSYNFNSHDVSHNRR